MPTRRSLDVPGSPSAGRQPDLCPQRFVISRRRYPSGCLHARNRVTSAHAGTSELRVARYRGIRCIFARSVDTTSSLSHPGPMAQGRTRSALLRYAFRLRRLCGRRRRPAGDGLQEPATGMEAGRLPMVLTWSVAAAVLGPASSTSRLRGTLSPRPACFLLVYLAPAGMAGSVDTRGFEPRTSL